MYKEVIMGRIYSISRWDNITDYDKFVKDADGVICRLGYSGNTTGELIEDKKFKEYITNLTGKTKLGVYFVTNAINEDDAINEAKFVVRTLKDNNVSVNFPIFVKVGYATVDQTGRIFPLTRITRTINVQTFLREIRNSGYTAGIYATEKWINSKLDINLLLDEIKWPIKYDGNSIKVPGKVFAWQKYQEEVEGADGLINISEYKEEVKPITISTRVSKSSITPGMKVVLSGVPAYKSSATETVSDFLSGEYYTWDAKVIKNRIRVTADEEDVGVRNGYKYWIRVDNIIV
jgi:hypothetical protein